MNFGIRVPYTLWWYVLSQFLKSFAIATPTCIVFFLLGKLWMYARELETFQVSVAQMIVFAPYFLPYALCYAIPLAAMIAAISTFGGLSADNEIAATQAAGAPLRTLLPPLAFSSLVLAGVCLALNDAGIQWGTDALQEHVNSLDDDPDFFAMLEKPGRKLTWPLEGDDGRKVHINLLPHLPPASGGQKPRRPIHVALFQNGSLLKSLYAEDHDYEQLKARLKGDHSTLPLRLNLRNALELGEEPGFFEEMEVELEIPRLSLAALGMEKTRGKQGLKDNLDDMLRVERSMPSRRKFLLENAAELTAQMLAGAPADPLGPPEAAKTWMETRLAATALAGTHERKHKHYVEFFRKLMLGLLPISLIVLGVGLGLLVRKGNRLIGFFLGLVTYGGVYYPLMVAGKELANLEVVSPAGALVAPNVLLLLLGAWLCRRAERGESSGFALFFHRLTTALASFLPFRGNVPEDAHELGSFASRASDDVPLRRRLLRFGPLRRLSGFLLDRYLGVSFFLWFVFLSVIVSVVFIGLDLLEKGDQIVQSVVNSHQPKPGFPALGRSEAALNAVTYYVISALELTTHLLPLLLLVAGILTVIALVRNNEHLLLKSSGISLRRMFRPVLVAALGLSLAVLILREVIMPTLLVERDRLRPLVHRCKANPYTVATHIPDEKNDSMLVEMSDYDPRLRVGHRLRAYPLGRRHYERVPMIVADRVVWDGKGWLLQTLKPKGDGGKDAKPTWEPRGWYCHMEPDDPDDIENTRWTWKRSPLKRWKSFLTPSAIDAERFGAQAMPFGELWRARAHSAEFRGELWRRMTEWLAGCLLLAVTLPMLMTHDFSGMLRGLIGCVCWSVVYVTAILIAAELGRQEILPTVVVFSPHVLMAIVAVVQQYVRLET